MGVMVKLIENSGDRNCYSKVEGERCTFFFWKKPLQKKSILSTFGVHFFFVQKMGISPLARRVSSNNFGVVLVFSSRKQLLQMAFFRRPVIPPTQ